MPVSNHLNEGYVDKAPEDLGLTDESLLLAPQADSKAFATLVESLTGQTWSMQMQHIPAAMAGCEPAELGESQQMSSADLPLILTVGTLAKEF